MNTAISRYLARRADLKSREFEGDSGDGVGRVIAIPALAEYQSLPKTLASVAENPSDLLRSTLVIVVVNNGPPSSDRRAARDENQATLAWLRDKSAKQLDDLRLGWVDAASPGKDLGAREGVGAARKLGLDWGLEILRRNEEPRGALINLDGDTLVDPDYLPVLSEHFGKDFVWGAVTAFAHRLEGPRAQRQAILRYELFLRYHVLGLSYARSPYAFHTLGSIMACTGSAYAAVSGMNRRRGGEDFYFLQQLAKTGSVATLSGTTVRPSSRPSWRVPFGTGPRIAEQMANADAETLAYAPDSYEVLREWLRCVSEGLDKGGEALTAHAETLHPVLAAYLNEQDFEEAWNRLKKHAPNEGQLLAQFHRWFDGLRTLRLIHRLREGAYPSLAVEDCLPAVAQWYPAAESELAACIGADDVCTRAVNLLRRLEAAMV